jgi:uncharacterized membrane protein YbjE (DUF340 family)
MITVVLVMTAGIVLGYLIRRKSVLIKINDKLITWAIYLLLFVLGISIGTNDTIMKSLPTLGLKAFAISIGGVIGSVIFAWFLYLKFFKSKEGL